MGQARVGWEWGGPGHNVQNGSTAETLVSSPPGGIETSLWLHSWRSEMGGLTKSLHKNMDWSMEGPPGSMPLPRGWEDTEG